MKSKKIRKELNELIKEDLKDLKKEFKNITIVLGVTVAKPTEDSRRVYFLGDTLGIVIYPSPERGNGDSHILFSILENYDVDDYRSWRILEYQSHSLFITKLRNVLVVAEEWMKKTL